VRGQRELEVISRPFLNLDLRPPTTEVSTRQIALSTVRGLFTNGSQENRRIFAKDTSPRESIKPPRLACILSRPTTKQPMTCSQALVFDWHLTAAVTRAERGQCRIVPSAPVAPPQEKDEQQFAHCCRRDSYESPDAWAPLLACPAVPELASTMLAASRRRRLISPRSGGGA